MNTFTLNPLSLQFKLKSPVLPDPSSLQISSGSGPSDQALIRPVLLPSALPPAISGHPSPGTSSPQFHLSLSSRHGFGVEPPLADQLFPSAASFPHLPESLGNLATTIAGQYSYLPESLGVGVTETISTIQELPSAGSSLIVMPYTQPGDDKREFFQKSGMDRIHASKPAMEKKLPANGLAPGGSRVPPQSQAAHVRPTIPPGFDPLTHGPGLNLIGAAKPASEKKFLANELAPGGSQAAPRAGHVRPTIPPGFNPLTHGPGMALIHHPVLEDAASAHTSSGTSNLNYTVVRQILNSQMEMSNRIMSIQENNMNLFNRLVNLKNETREKIDKMDASIITSVQPLIGRIEAMESRGAEKERLYVQILSSDQEEVKTIEDEIEFMEEQNKAEKEEEEKSEAKKKKGLKYLGFGGIILAGIGATYLYLKK